MRFTLRRHTWLAWRYLDRFVEPEAIPDDFDIEAFVDDFTWRQDPLRGLADYASHVDATLERGSGDCEDFSLVVLSWIVREDGIAHFGFGYRPHLAWGRWRGIRFPRHVFAWDGDRVYEAGGSGARIWGSLDEYTTFSRYHDVRHRPVNPP
ncbi:MAG: hypothetical protein ACOC42_00930 [Halobacteriota archaeon]